MVLRDHKRSSGLELDAIVLEVFFGLPRHKSASEMSAWCNQSCYGTLRHSSYIWRPNIIIHVSLNRVPVQLHWYRERGGHCSLPLTDLALEKKKASDASFVHIDICTYIMVNVFIGASLRTTQSLCYQIRSFDADEKTGHVSFDYFIYLFLRNAECAPER